MRKFLLATTSLPQSAKPRLVFRFIFLNPSGNKIYFPRFIKAQVVTSPPMSNWLCSYKMVDQGTEILITRLGSKTWNS